jgi:hypothetical protein
MAGEVLNIKVLSPLKLRSGLTGKYHTICHYSYNLPLSATRCTLLNYPLPKKHCEDYSPKIFYYLDEKSHRKIW